MKNTSQARSNSAKNVPLPPAEKPSIPGQNGTTIGQVKEQAIAIIAEWQQVTPTQFVTVAAESALLVGIKRLQKAICDESRPAEKASAQTFYTRLQPLLEPLCIKLDYDIRTAQTEVPDDEGPDGPSALLLLEEAVRASKALSTLMFLAICQEEGAERFREDNGYLAAGLQTLIYGVKYDLELAEGAVGNRIRKLKKLA
jgi:hypothetical protein